MGTPSSRGWGSGGLLAPAVAAVLALLAAGPARAANQTVVIPHLEFVPDQVAVMPGETVTWDNQDDHEEHNVVFDDGSFSQPSPAALGPWTVSRAFSVPEGVYRYYCQVHGGPGGQGMSGIVYVNPTGTVPPPQPVAPVASFAVTPSSAAIGQMVGFDATGSSDTDGTIAKYEWDLDGDGSFETDTGTAATTSRSYTGAGTLTIKLRVTDSQTLTHETERSLVITPAAPGVKPPAPLVPAPKATVLPPPPPSFASSRRSSRVTRSGRFAFSFRASAGLTGTVKFSSVNRVTTSARRRVNLGTKRFTVPGAGVVTVRMKLSRKNLRILKRNGRIRFRAGVTLRNAAGLTRSASASLTLKKPR